MDAQRKRTAAVVPLVIGITMLLGSCSLGTKQADLEEFVATGLSMVSIKACAWETAGHTVARIPSGAPIVGTIAMINPKEFDISYSLGWDQDASLFSALPPTAPSPSDKKNFSINLSLLPSAEHKTFTFTLGKYVASINKTYPTETFSVVCDSPPDPATLLVTAVDSAQKAVLGIVLPSGAIDDDLDKAEITWNKSGESSPSSATYTLASLRAAPSPDPFSGSFGCYFQPPNITAGSAYSFSVVLIDAAGQRSSAVSTDSVANAFTLTYDANGGGASTTSSHAYGETITVPGQGALSLGTAAFGGWNTRADGLGTAYAPGSTFSMPANAVMLYAQWLGTVSVHIDLGTQTLNFSSSSLTVAQGTSISLSCANTMLSSAGSGWQWYVDGAQVSGQSTGSFLYATDNSAIGQHIVSCLVFYLGITYSGSLRVTVSDGGSVGP